MIKRLIITSTLIISFLPLFTSTVRASILSVGKNGDITWKVLSEKDDSNIEIPTHSYIEVTKVADSQVSPKSSIELSKNGDKVNLLVFNANEKRQIDVSSENADLIEIEERPAIQKINIGIRDNKFSLKQKGIFATTEYPIKVDPQSARLTIGTKSGERFLAVLPYDAVQGVLRTKLIDRINNNLLQILEEESELQYAFSGEKVFNVFDFYEYSIPVSLKVSATTGETVSIEGPTWYKIIGFFLS